MRDKTGIVIVLDADGIAIGGHRFKCALNLTVTNQLFGMASRTIDVQETILGNRVNRRHHVYDEIGMAVIEDMASGTVAGLLFLIERRRKWTDPLPTGLFTGSIIIGGVSITANTTESELTASSLEVEAVVAGVRMLSTGTVNIMVDMMGSKLPSGRRSKEKKVMSILLLLPKIVD